MKLLGWKEVSEIKSGCRKVYVYILSFTNARCHSWRLAPRLRSAGVVAFHPVAMPQLETHRAYPCNPHNGIASSGSRQQPLRPVKLDTSLSNVSA